MPDFASQQYWDTRFSKDNKPFDWLVPAKALCQITTDMIDAEAVKKSQILHIGCGTSETHLLRQLVDDPEQIHNVDYSEPAIEAAAEREKELLSRLRAAGKEADDLLETAPDDGADGGEHGSVQSPSASPAGEKFMRWSCMDLLNLQSTLGLLHHHMQQQSAAPKLYDIVLDKSTSDSISIGADLPLALPYALSISGWTRRILRSGTQSIGNVHPLHVLAIHLAALTTPGKGRWIAVSYSEERFPFLPPFPATPSSGLLSDDVIKMGFPHPSQLWKLERKERIELMEEEEETLAERKRRMAAGRPVMRPKISHWLYVLRRTDAVVID